MTKKVLYITSLASQYGSEESFINLLRHLDRAKFDPFVLTVRGPLIDTLKKYNIPFKEHKTLTLTRANLISYILLVLQLTCFIRRGKYRIIHANDIRSAQYAILAARLANVPSILHIRFYGLETWLKWKNRAIFRLASGAIAISNKVKDSLIQSDFPEKRIHLIYNGVDLDRFHNNITGQSFRTEAGVKEGDILIGVVGRIIPFKGQDIFLKALPYVIKKYPNAKFAIVGEDTTPERDYIKKLEELVRDLGLIDRVYFSGFKQNIPEVMKAFDILVVPSTNEPFGRVIIESMAVNVPVIASSVGGIPDIIQNETNGILIPANDSDAISNAIVKILTNKNDYDRIAFMGRKTVEKKFSIQNHVKQVEKLYNSLI